MYDEYEFTDDFLRNMCDYFRRYNEATRNHIKQLEGELQWLRDRIERVENQNEMLKTYIKSGEKIVELEKDFSND